MKISLKSWVFNSESVFRLGFYDIKILFIIFKERNFSSAMCFSHLKTTSKLHVIAQNKRNKLCFWQYFIYFLTIFGCLGKISD